MIVEKIHRSEIRPAAYNPRKISDEAKRKLALSLNEFDLVEPLVWNRQSGNLVGGHQRLYILDEKNGTDYEVEVSIVDLPPAKEKALNVALNNQLMAGEWDFPKLNDLIVEIDTGEFDIEITGFNYGELEKIIGYERPGSGNGGAPEAQINKADELQKKWQVQRGQIWEIGNHRLMCGDSTNAEMVQRLFNGQRAVLMNTDPPYGVNYGDIANSRTRAADIRHGGDGKDYQSQPYPDIENDDLDGEKLQEFLEAAIRSALPILIENPAFYLWHPMLTQGTFFAAAAADILIHRQIIWVKPSLIMGRGDYHWRHELCFYGWIRGKHCVWYGDRKQDTVWQIGRENDGIHPTQKPIELFTIPLRNHSRLGEICYDPFLGSGTQLIAAEQLGRICYGMEIHPPYCAVILQRMTDMGLKPQLISSQKP